MSGMQIRLVIQILDVKPCGGSFPVTTHDTYFIFLNKFLDEKFQYYSF